MNLVHRFVVLVFTIVFFTAYSCPLFASPSPPVNQESISDPKNEWLSYGRDYQEQRFSPLDSLNRENVAELDLAWSFEFATARGMEATPLVHNGVIYISTGWSHVYALDARTGTQIWHYDAKVDKAHLVKTCCGPVNRGVALWQADDEAELQVFFGALDGRLIALNAATGKPNWSAQTTPTDGNYSITGAPRVVKGMVVIGNGGAELGVRGFVSAYDVITGEMRWRFYTVPGDPKLPQENAALQKALETWQGDYWYQQGGGGGTAWDSLVYDPKLDLLYIGTGNGSPWNRDVRSPGGGDNLYLSSIVALKPDTGEYVWHYQTTPKENWDYTATQQLVLAKLEIEGVSRDVIMQAPKNGFFYVLDRKTGELLSADAYTHISWASHVDMQTGRPVETDFADYQKTGGSILWPGPIGAHNWQAMSFSAKTGYVYIPVQNVPSYYFADNTVEYHVGRWNTGIDLYENREIDNWVSAKAMADALIYGELVAWDPIKKQRAWSVRHQYPSNGGILTTAGDLLFQGTQEGTFAAYDTEGGERLWQYKSDSAILAGPISYQVDGEQYIAVAQGSGGALMLNVGSHSRRNAENQNRLLVFKKGQFNRTKRLESEESGNRVTSILALGHEAQNDQETIDLGARLYARNCSSCHGVNAKGNGVIPDLRIMSEKTHQQFMAIVIGGLLKDKGMVGFYETLDISDADAIHAYLDQQQINFVVENDMSFTQKIEYWVVYWSSKLGERFPWFANATRDWVM